MPSDHAYIPTPSIMVLVPVKALAQAKQRLGPLLDQGERRRLSMAMARDTLTALTAVSDLAVTVCAGDTDGQRLAGAFAIPVVREGALQASGLNGITSAFAQRASAEGYTHLAIIHADLPLLRGDTVRHFLAAAVSHDVAVIADRRKQGTNLISWRLDCGFLPDFGSDSYPRHIAQCERLGISAYTQHSDDAALDIDRPADLLLLHRQRQLSADSQTLSVLREDRLIERILIASGITQTLANNNVTR